MDINAILRMVAGARLGAEYSSDGQSQMRAKCTCLVNLKFRRVSQWLATYMGSSLVCFSVQDM